MNRSNIYEMEEVIINPIYVNLIWRLWRIYQALFVDTQYSFNLQFSNLSDLLSESDYNIQASSNVSWMLHKGIEEEDEELYDDLADVQPDSPKEAPEPNDRADTVSPDEGIMEENYDDIEAVAEQAKKINEGLCFSNIKSHFTICQ